MKVDPFTVEVLRNAFPAITNEMSSVLKRSSYNMMIYEVGDYSCALLDTAGRLISQNTGGVSHFVADLGVVIKDGMRTIAEFHPGDVVIMNHQAVCGQHLNNICIYTPFFFRDELLGFAMNRAHWIDVGGFSTGFSSNLAKDPWQEGLQLNQLKIYEKGQPNHALLGLIADNIRMPESSMGDLRAQIAACRLGVKRLEELLEQYGKETTLAAIEEIFNHAEAKCRRVVEGIPNGTYRAESQFDDGVPGVSDPIRIAVTVTVADDEMTIDLSECSSQRLSSVNGRTLAAPYVAYKCLTGPLDPLSEGSFRGLRVILPEGNFMMAKFPAPMAQWSVALPSVVDTILAALADAIPDAVPAAHKAGFGDFITFWGEDPRTGKRFVVQSIEGGGWGGRPLEDGPSATVTVCQGDVRNSPIESLEQRFPIVVEERALRPDSGGAGKFRGGLGVDVTVRGLVEGRWNLPQTGRYRFPAWGLNGGLHGGRTDKQIKLPDQTEWSSINASWHAVPAQTLVKIRSGGGGGWGVPQHRDPQLVLRDVRNGLVSPTAAREQYGVTVVDTAEGFELDESVISEGLQVQPAT